MLSPEPIRTDRLKLEPVTVEIARAVLDEDLSAINAGDGWPHPGTFRGLGAALATGRPPGWFVVLGDVVIGDCGIHGEPDEFGSVEFGFGLAPPYQGMGYGTEALVGLSAWLLARDDVVEVIGHTDPANIASRRAMEKAGFVRTSGARGRVRYTLT